MAKITSPVTSEYSGICDVGELIQLIDGIFLFRGQRAHLIYAGILPKLLICDYITKIVKNGGRAKNCEPLFIRCAHIPPEHSNGYGRTHVIIDFGRVWKCILPDKLDYDGVRPCWKAVKRVTHWNCLLNYMAESDPENIDLINRDQDEARFVTTLDDLQHMIIREPTEHDTINNQQLNNINQFYFNTEECRWSYKVLELTNKMIDYNGGHRNIRWLYSSNSIGKSTLGMWMEEKFNSWLYINYAGRSCDMIRTLENEMNVKGWDKRTSGIHGIYVDIGGMTNNNIELYRFLDTLWNRKITSSKYNSNKIVIRHRIHMVVAASWPPEFVVRDNYGIARPTLSIDRLDVWEIVNNHIISHIDNNKLLNYQVNKVNTSLGHVSIINEYNSNVDIYDNVVELPTKTTANWID